jgi:hypothetical protein
VDPSRTDAIVQRRFANSNLHPFVHQQWKRVERDRRQVSRRSASTDCTGERGCSQNRPRPE